MQFDTKIAVVLRDDLAGWQKTNVTAFVVSGIAGTVPGVVGEPYRDASGNEYLPMFVQPVRTAPPSPASPRSAAVEQLTPRGRCHTDRLPLGELDLLVLECDRQRSAQDEVDLLLIPVAMDPPSLAGLQRDLVQAEARDTGRAP